jgi:exodeoxyribonuclease V alpha subunit
VKPPPDQEFIDIDRHFADFIERFGGDERLMRMAAASLSRSIREGNICLPLTKPLPQRVEERKEEEENNSLRWPAMKEWRSAFATSKAVGGPAAQTPLVIDASSRLYLRRYWSYQERLARALREKASRNKTKRRGGTGTREAAIEAAVENYLTIISGGPGTGKTTAVLDVLKYLLQQTGGQPLRIALVAPTGKAAVRLEEIVRNGLLKLECSDEVLARIPRTASTIHRLLGRKGNSVYFRHDQRNPLPLDLLVIDEASMVALPLLCKVFDALPEHCRVILLGDHQQLASVEPGAVLADIVEAAASVESPLSQAVATLKKNYRFSEKSGVHRLCEVVRQGKADQAIQILREQSHPDIVSREIHEAPKLVTSFAEVILNGFSSFVVEREPAGALKKLENFRVLAALRRGPFGVEGLNREIEQILLNAGLIPEQETPSYSGRPILITKNDYQLQLFNGDVGVLLPDPAETGDPDHLWAWFMGKENVPRRFAPARLPEYESAYAMTVHKSQGSEFERVLFILPDEDVPVLTRELIYTGLTRARAKVELWWNEAAFAKGVTRRAERNSGLRDLLAAPIAKVGRPRQEQLHLFSES